MNSLSYHTLIEIHTLIHISNHVDNITQQSAEATLALTTMQYSLKEDSILQETLQNHMKTIVNEWLLTILTQGSKWRITACEAYLLSFATSMSE